MDLPINGARAKPPLRTTAVGIPSRRMRSAVNMLGTHIVLSRQRTAVYGLLEHTKRGIERPLGGT